MERMKIPKDKNGNDPFWVRCPVVSHFDELPNDYVKVNDVFDLIIIDPINENGYIKMDLYRMKKGYVCLYQNNKYRIYDITDELYDYDIEPFINEGKCFAKFFDE